MDSLIKIDGKPIEKLIEVISAGLSVLYRPRRIRKEADAKAYAIQTIERAKNKAQAEGKIIEAETWDRINDRLIAKEKKRQDNIDDVVEIAAKTLESQPTVSDVPVHPDWTTRFFDIVQDISDEDMKKLWGQILAGEVKSPGSYTLRTLELLRNITKEEAETFVKVAQFVLYSNGYFILEGRGGGLPEFGISYSDIANLTEIGLIQAGTFVGQSFKSLPDKKSTSVILYQNKLQLSITLDPGVEEVFLSANVLTRAGKELYQLIPVTPNIDYLKAVAAAIKRPNVSVEYAEIRSVSDDGRIHYQQPIIPL